MKRFAEFLKTTVLGGALIVLPIWLTVLLLLKAVMQLQIFVKPVTSALPPDVAHPRILALLVLLAVCFAVGAAVRTAIGGQARRAVERNVFERMPGYTTLRSMAQQLGHIEGEHGFQPALVEIEEALAPAFIIEQHPDGQYTVFVPSAPTPMAGTIFIIAGARVHPVDVPFTTAFQIVTKWGAGSAQLLAGMQRKA